MPEGWVVKDGVIHLDQSKPEGGNIITRVEYGDFDLSYEWKIAKGGNNGVKYRVKKYGNSWLGLEYQMLDETEGWDHGKLSSSSTASVYVIHEPNEKTRLKPLDEYNQTRILVQGNKIKHWLNGELVLEVTVGDADWRARVAKSKFKDHEGFGEDPMGRLMLTDHGADVWIRNFKLTPLPAKDGAAGK